MNSRAVVSLSGLPASLVDVAETLGLPIAVRLMQHFGGQELMIPKRRPAADHPLTIALGEDDALAVSDFMGGMTIYVPHDRATRVLRKEILRLQDEGLDRNEIARTLGISARHVRRLANGEGGPDPRQLDLFSDRD